MGTVLRLDEMIGLTRQKAMARRDVAASKAEKERFPNTGFFGPGGLGKTTLGQAIALDLGVPCRVIEGAAIADRKACIEYIVTADRETPPSPFGWVLFVDEAHRLGATQEALYFIMTDWKVTSTSGDICFKPFTVMAATTHPNMLMSPFLSRLQNKWFLEPYSPYEMAQIVNMHLKDHRLNYDYLVVRKIASRCLGNPRIASNLCRTIRNTVVAKGRRVVNQLDCDEAFALEGIDELGLGREHVRYLTELFNANGTPKGLGAISGKLGLIDDVVAGSIEPVLLQLGFIDLTGRGRVLTRKGHLHLAQSGLV